MSDLAFELRHRPLELAEKRELKRELEVERYNEYIAKLKTVHPELWISKRAF